jgi:peptidoglycan LD-endopeptidase CwlK
MMAGSTEANISTPADPPPRLDARAERALVGVHPDLVKVVRRAAVISPIPFTVTEGLRSLQRQKALIAAGASRTLRSRHLTGHAVDLAAKVEGRIRWDWPLYVRLATAVKQAAGDLGVEIEWGGDWPKLRDGPHFQLTWARYP